MPPTTATLTFGGASPTVAFATWLTVLPFLRFQDRKSLDPGVPFYHLNYNGSRETSRRGGLELLHRTLAVSPSLETFIP